MAMVGTRVVARTTATFTAMAVSHPSRIINFLSWKNCSSITVVPFSRSRISLQRWRHHSPPPRFFNGSVTFCSSASVSVEATDVPPSPAEPTVATAADLDALDIRVGMVVKAWKHPEADSLYVEEVDLAEAEGPRTICSGLVNYLSLEELQGRAVVVLANLKARSMRGVKSNGMLLAASDAAHTTVQLLSPPEGAVAGDRIWFGSESDQANQAPAATPNQVQKKKIWETVQPGLRTTEDCVAAYDTKPMRTSAGTVTCKSLQGANIS